MTDITAMKLGRFKNHRALHLLDRDGAYGRESYRNGRYLRRVKLPFEIDGIEGVMAAHQDSPLDKIFQFPDIPRPGLPGQPFQRCRADRKIIALVYYFQVSYELAL